MYQQKRMFKVVSPIDMPGGGKYWMRCGTGFVNKDNSINVYLDALPLRAKAGEGVTLQIREFTEDELRERAEKKASYSARGTLGDHSRGALGDHSRGALGDQFTAPLLTSEPSSSVDNVPF